MSTFISYFILPIDSANQPSNLQEFGDFVLIPKDQFHSDIQINFITKILQSIDLIDHQNVQIILLEDRENFLLTRMSSPSTKRIISMGVKPEQLCMQACEELYKVYKIENFTILFADGPDLLQNEVNRRKLWTSLKEMYNK
ncbi:MAG: hypothetical protein M3Q56_04360 [Bacteroidota bacterium]|nr:hypothetical protein [Bacteroidota bacterium]